MTPLLTRELAVRLEAGCVAEMRADAEAGRDSRIYPRATFASLSGGGGALWMGPGCTINGAAGIGMAGPVPPEAIERLVSFFAEAREDARVDACPLAHPSLLPALARHGFRATSFESQLLRPLSVTDPPAPQPLLEVREIRSPADRAVWADLVARGFGDERPTDDELRLGRAMSLREDVRHFVGYVDGEPAGTGLLWIDGDLAWLNADSTLPAFRGRGVQSAVLSARLGAAAEAGCALARIEAVPGTASHRNQQRMGFHVAYTRTAFVRPAGWRERR